MKSAAAALFVLGLVAVSPASASQVNPIEKIMEMISDLQAKVKGESEDAQKVYDEYSEFCEDRSTNLGFEIKTGKANKAELEATIEEETSTILALETKIEELSNDIKTDEADLDAATKIREKENADFKAEEKELTEDISMLERATILSKEMAKSGASMLRVKRATSITETLSVMVQASVLSSADASRLTELVQTGQSDSDTGAPAAAVYERHSDGIIGTFEGLTEKADGQLNKARKTETTAVQKYEMLKQSLTDEIKFANKDMDKAKKGLSESQENKAVATGDLEVTEKDLAEDIKTKATLHQDCMTAAEEFELATKRRGEELKALATAIKVIKESTGGAADQSYELSEVAEKEAQLLRDETTKVAERIESLKASRSETAHQVEEAQKEAAERIESLRASHSNFNAEQRLKVVEAQRKAQLLHEETMQIVDQLESLSASLSSAAQRHQVEAAQTQVQLFREQTTELESLRASLSQAQEAAQTKAQLLRETKVAEQLDSVRASRSSAEQRLKVVEAQRKAQLLHEETMQISEQIEQLNASLSEAKQRLEEIAGIKASELRAKAKELPGDRRLTSSDMFV